MKRSSLILAIVLCLSMLAGCCLSHQWVEADCTAPRTCAKCEKTEGEALGHDWADADCVAPKTCSRCGETEGEALGHSYSGWEATETDTMVSTCATCGDRQEEPVDRELIGRQQLLGKWELTSVTLSGMWFDYSPGWTLEFREDGTFDFTMTDLESGEIVYVEFYVGEHMDFYVFDGNTQEHSYSFNYEPEEDVVYIIGSEYFKFTRVTE